MQLSPEVPGIPLPPWGLALPSSWPRDPPTCSPLEVWGRRLGTSRLNSRPEPETRELRLDNQEPRPGEGEGGAREKRGNGGTTRKQEHAHKMEPLSGRGVRVWVGGTKGRMSAMGTEQDFEVKEGDREARGRGKGSATPIEGRE